MATTATTKPKAVDKWHHHYDDPRDDTVLITNNNVKFRVSSRLLCKHSEYFKSLFAPSDGQNIDVKPAFGCHEPLPVDLPELTLDRFLSMLSPTSRQLILAGLTFQQCQELLTFTEQYQCRELINLIRIQLEAKTVKIGEPTTLFIFASDRDDWLLGRFALQKMTSHEVYVTTEGTRYSVQADGPEANVRAFFAKLRPEWQQALMYLLFFTSFNKPSSHLNWSAYAGRFAKSEKSLKRSQSDPPTDPVKKVKGG